MKLRAEIVDEGASLLDPLVEARHPVDADLRAALAGKASEAAARKLMLLGLVEGANDAVRARLREVRAGAALQIHALDGARFSCQRSGGCCRGYHFGPLDDEDAARLQALPIVEKLPHLAGAGLFVAEEWTAQRRALRIATVEGRCVFLLPDERCGLHAAFGAEAKPNFCRLYPLQALPTVDGIKLYDRGECASFAESAFAGPRLADEIERLRPLLPCNPLYHPPVQIAQNLVCDYGYLLALVRRLIADVEAAPSSLAGLVAAARRARAFADALARCPIADGEPDRTAGAALALPSEALPPAGSAEIGRAALGSLADTLARAADGPFAEVFARAARGLAAAARAGGTLPAPADDAPWRLSLRHALFGRQLLVEEKLPVGLLRIAVAQAIGRAGAAQTGSASLGHVAAVRTLLHGACSGWLVANGRLWGVIAEALPSLFA